jgi:hypothetical protein
MTTIAELGRMLIEVGENGRKLEIRGENEWWLLDIDLAYSVSLEKEYRLKPLTKTTYYRVYKNAVHNICAKRSDCSFENEQLHPSLTHIKDFEITEEIE